MSTQEFLTTEVLQGLLRESHPDVRLTSFEATAGSGRGDNYTAVLYRVEARGHRGCGGGGQARRQRRGGKRGGEDEEEQGLVPWKGWFILKALPENPETREAYQSETLFRNEIAFYTCALPALLDFQARMGVHRPFRGVPACFHAKDIIVLEDLRSRGFRMADRKAGLDLAHIEAALSLLAPLHALSLAMRAAEPQEFKSRIEDSVREVVFTPENEAWYRGYYRSASRAACSIVRDAFPSSEVYLRRLQNFADDGFFQRMVELVSAKSAECCINSSKVETYKVPLVLCHGDCWTNNIMFRYDHPSDTSAPRRIVEVCLLDFQMARVGSPAMDLASLLYCCTSRELRRSHLERLLNLYWSFLQDALKDLVKHGEDTNNLLTKETLWREMARCSRFGLGIALDMIPISTCDSNVAPDMYSAGGNDAHAEDEGPEKFDLLKAPPSDEGRRRMSELVQELVDNSYI